MLSFFLRQHFANALQVGNELTIPLVTLFAVRCAQHGRGMDCSRYMRRPAMRAKLSAFLGETELRAKQCLGRGRAQTHDHFRFEHGHLALKPRDTGPDLGCTGLFVQSSLAALLKFEMFHGVSHVYGRTVQARVVERFVQQPAGGSYERTALAVFFIARLLADHGDARGPRPFSEYGLSCVPIQIAASAALDGRSQGRPAGMWRDELGRAGGLYRHCAHDIGRDCAVEPF